MTMKFNKVKISLLNLDREEITLRLPVKNSELRKLLIAKNVVCADQSKVHHLDGRLKSVTKTELRNFIIEKPTNIYYLNSYFLFLKEKDWELPEENITITTEKLKELIADIFNFPRKDMTLEEIFQTLNSSNTQKELKKEKPIFSIYQLQANHRERKRRQHEETKE